MTAEHIETLVHDGMPVRLVAAYSPVFSDLTYGKRVSKSLKGTEKANNLL